MTVTDCEIHSGADFLDTTTLHDLTEFYVDDDAEREAQEARADRAKTLREQRRQNEWQRLQQHYSDKAEQAHTRAAGYSDLERHCIDAGDQRGAEHYAQSFNNATAEALRFEILAERQQDGFVRPTGHRGGLPVRDLTPDSFRWATDRTSTVIGREFDQDPELPEPTDVADPSPRFITEVSNAQSWAWEPSGEVVVRPAYVSTKNGVTRTVPAQVKEKRSYPGMHVIGTSIPKRPAGYIVDAGDSEFLDAMAFAKEAIITMWSAARQCWIVVRCHEGPRKNGFTQWIPSAWVQVHQPAPLDDERTERPIARSSLDAHSDATARALDEALRMASRWAMQVRREKAIADPDPLDEARLGMTG